MNIVRAFLCMIFFGSVTNRVGSLTKIPIFALWTARKSSHLHWGCNPLGA